MKELRVLFPGGKQVDVQVDGFLIKTDQSPSSGGAGLFPEPFDYFLASLATCAGLYALNFCDRRGISSIGMRLSLRCQWNQEKRLYDRMEFVLSLPREFPNKYRGAIVKAMQLCTVKRHMERYSEIDMSFEVVSSDA